MAIKELLTRISLRNAEASEWTSKNPILLRGEVGIEINTRKFKFGDGIKTWNELPYANADLSELGGISAINGTGGITASTTGTVTTLSANLSETTNNALQLLSDGLHVDSASFATSSQGEKADSSVQQITSTTSIDAIGSTAGGIKKYQLHLFKDTNPNNAIQISSTGVLVDKSQFATAAQGTAAATAVQDIISTSSINAVAGTGPNNKPRYTLSVINKNDVNNALTIGTDGLFVDKTQFTSSADKYLGVTQGNGITVTGTAPAQQTISAKLSSATDNVITNGAAGLLATIDLNYSSSTGKLTLIKSGASGVVTKDISLPLESFLESGTYNKATEEIWLTVKTPTSTSPSATTVIKIPVGDLITEWGTLATDSVTLAKTRVVNGTDVLSANVNISPKANNALVLNTATEKGLYVQKYVHPDHTGDVTSTGDGVTVIGASKVTSTKIAAGAVNDSHISNVNVNKLVQTEGDYILINCGGA